MLYEGFMVPCTRKVRTRAADGEGGNTSAWEDGEAFRAAIVLESGMGARVAEKEGVTALYTVTTDGSVPLAFHDAFERDADGATFRITKANDPAPHMASFSFDQYQAERWDLP